MSNDEAPQTAEQTSLAKGVFAQFFQKNKPGIQYVNADTKTYYISRRWTLRGPIPPGVKIEHTGLATGGSRGKRRRR